MKATLPALTRPAAHPAVLALGERVYGGWRYACVACGVVVALRHQWTRPGNKHNGWGVYLWPNGSGAAAFCPDCAVAETADRARGS